MTDAKENLQAQKNIVRSSFLCGLAIGVFCFLLTLIITPLEWDFYDGFLTHLINGIATHGVLSKFYIYGFFLIPDLYMHLQHIDGNVPWTGIITMFFLLMANVLFVSCALFVIKSRYRSLTFTKVFLFLVPLFFIIQFPVISRPSYTGLSFLLCGSVLLFITILSDSVSGVRKLVMYVLLSFIYFWGICIRLESGIGASIIVILFIVLTSTRRIFSLLKISPLLFVGLLTGIAIVSTLDSIPFLKKTEASLFYVSDGVNQGNIFNGLSARDSVKTVAVKRFFINDEKEITESFINNIARRKAAQELAHPIEITQRLRTAWQIGHKAITAQYLIILINLLLLTMIFLTERRKISILLFQIGFWAITLGLAYTVKLEERHFLYMLEIYTYCNIIILAYSFPITYKMPLIPKLIYSAVAVIFVCVIFAGVERSKIVSRKLNQYDLAGREVNIMAKDKLLLLDGDSKFIFHGGPFTVRHFSSPRAIVFYDMGELPILTQYNAYLDKLCSCNSKQVPVFYDFLLKNKDDVLIISTDSRNSFIQSYMKVVYNRDIRFNILKGSYAINAIGPSDEHLNYYTISD